MYDIWDNDFDRKFDEAVDEIARKNEEEEEDDGGADVDGTGSL